MIDLIIYYIFFIVAFNSFSQEKYLLKAFCLFLIVNLTFTFFNYIFDVNIGFYYICQSVILYYIMIIKLISKIKDDKLNKKNIFLIFYKPKTLKQNILCLFGLSYASCGLLMYNDKEKKYFIYQMRYENKVLQKRILQDKNYLKKYLIVKTDLKIEDFTKDIENTILQQKARQRKTLYLRFNCLRSLRFILNKSDKFKYKGEILPCFYLLKLKIKKIL